MQHLLFFLLLTTFSFCWACQSAEHAPPSTEVKTDSAVVFIDTPWQLTVADPFILRYRGEVQGQAISLQLINWGNGQLDGLWGREGEEAWEMFGEINLDESFSMGAYRGDQEAGQLSGQLKQLNQFRAEWLPAGAETPLPITFRWEFPSADPQGWAGDWYLNGLYDGGMLVIGNVTASTFDFALSVHRNGSGGEVWSRASYQGDHANLDKVLFEGLGPCKMDFTHRGGYIELKQESSSIGCGLGAGAYADGKYEAESVTTHPELAYEGPEAVFPSQAMHDAFHEQVGPELYELFAFNMQSLQKREVKNAGNGYPGHLHIGAVRGVFGGNEAAILHDSTYYWAATLDYVESEESSVILYFSSAPAWQDRMPPALRNWAEAFSGFELIMNPVQ